MTRSASAVAGRGRQLRLFVVRPDRRRQMDPNDPGRIAEDEVVKVGVPREKKAEVGAYSFRRAEGPGTRASGRLQRQALVGLRPFKPGGCAHGQAGRPAGLGVRLQMRRQLVPFRLRDRGRNQAAQRVDRSRRPTMLVLRTSSSRLREGPLHSRPPGCPWRRWDPRPPRGRRSWAGSLSKGPPGTRP